jgi:hypothetical protein
MPAFTNMVSIRVSRFCVVDLRAELATGDVDDRLLSELEQIDKYLQSEIPLQR